MPDTFTSHFISSQRPTANTYAITPNKNTDLNLFSSALNASENGIMRLTTAADTVGLY